MPETVEIARLGSAGDGIAETAAGPLYVRDALPGEIVAVERTGRGTARVVERIAARDDRVRPFCPHYERCGGCVAQHIGPTLYDEWKRGRVIEALAREKVAASVENLVDAHGAGRRRVVFHARDRDGKIEVGFMEAGSHRLVPIDTCPAASPALAGAAEVAAALARCLRTIRKPIDIAVSGASSQGLDVDLRGSGPVGDRMRQALIAQAASAGVARLSLHGDVLAEFRQPAIGIGRAQVVPPAGGFLQATAAGEEALAVIVVDSCRGARRVADLFAGIGPFAIRLAEAAEVHAVDGDASALSALDRGARAATGLRRVTTETRDLFRRPLLTPELDRYDAVVLDPPRAGADAQCRQLILSSCRAVIMVSCDPVTFARDAATLVAGGYVLERVVPIDQFRWTAHVEIVGVFRRPRAVRARRIQG